MRSEDRVRYCDVSGELEFGSEHIVNQTCVVLGLISVVGLANSLRMSEFRRVSELVPRPGEWWITRGRVVVLVATVDDETDQMIVVVEEGQSCRLEVYYCNGRYSQSQETELDLICPADGKDCRLGAEVGFGVKEMAEC